MPPPKKLLTISIPTWNRARFLGPLLDQVTEQVVRFSLQGKVEILVSNNASEDNTEDVIHKFLTQFPFVRYNKNETNTGAKSNVLKSMELATSTYVMFLGDDDRIRKNVLPEIITALESAKDIGLILDQTHFRWKKYPSNAKLELADLVQAYYWGMGNAGHFIVKTEYIKKYLGLLGYDYFNECWPQTQLQILGLQNSSQKALVSDLGILATESLHDELMAKTSFYLWRTCYYELLISINTLRDKIDPPVYHAARIYLKNNLPQQIFNILQCGLFVDNREVKKKTVWHIKASRHLFSFYEKVLLEIIIIALTLPESLSRPIANVFIVLVKGKAGLEKKNKFVENEMKKKTAELKNDVGAVRKLSFEKEF